MDAFAFDERDVVPRLEVDVMQSIINELRCQVEEQALDIYQRKLVVTELQFAVERKTRESAQQAKELAQLRHKIAKLERDRG